MNDLLERLKDSYDNLSERERRLVTALGMVLAALVLCLPLLLMQTRNDELADENDAIRELLDEIAEDGPKYAMMAEERRTSKARYLNRTPPLGSFLEAEAARQGLTVQEFNDQPQKTVGKYVKRNVRISLPKVALTPALNLMSSIVTSNYPVAIEQIQFEHYQKGDSYNIKLGVLTYDKEGVSPTKKVAKPETASVKGEN
ncbi:MAG: type II secretion system protein GspM [Myxococcales bacterium]|nr:type II secretion system protein GspM [Myxococcales bacterium]MDD9965281.1 type II secretion system protein GspM [Myxococcales bacterium]